MTDQIPDHVRGHWPQPDYEPWDDAAPKPRGFPPGITATPDGVMTLRRTDGSRLSFAPATTETGELADGWDWTRYSAGDSVEAQDWAETEEDMFGVLTEFARS